MHISLSLMCTDICMHRCMYVCVCINVFLSCSLYISIYTMIQGGLTFNYQILFGVTAKEIYSKTQHCDRVSLS